MNRDDIYRLNVDITGNDKRRYSLNVDAPKVVKGARLIEYQPKITLSLPSMAPMEFTGTVVFSKGRKAQLSVNMESRSFSSPFTIKGMLNILALQGSFIFILLHYMCVVKMFAL